MNVTILNAFLSNYTLFLWGMSSSLRFFSKIHRLPHCFKSCGKILVLRKFQTKMAICLIEKSSWDQESG